MEVGEKLSQTRAEESASELTVLLKSWYAGRDNDSIQIQRSRLSQLVMGESLLDRLVYEISPPYKTIFTVGEIAVTGTRFNKGAYDFYSKRDHRVLPRRDISLTRTERWTHAVDNPLEPENRRTLFAGNFRSLVSIDQIAAGLSGGGHLSVVEPNET